VMRSVFQSLGVAILGTLLQLRGTPAGGFQGIYTMRGYDDAYRVAFFAALFAIALAIFLPVKPRKRSALAPASVAEPPRALATED
jgi:hypothetical protein